MTFRIPQILIALDQLANTLLGGWADETISARAWRLHKEHLRWGCLYRLINIVMMSRSHCRDSYLACKDRAYSPPEGR